MATITLEARSDIISLVVGMFGAAPGASVLSDLVAAYESGSSVAQIAANVANTTEYTSMFPTFLTNSEFATKVVNQLLAEASTDAKAEAVTVLTAELNGGTSKIEAFIKAINFVANSAAGVTAYATSAAAFDNKVEVATYYSVEKQLSGSSLSDLQTVIATVTSSADSVVAAKAVADGTSNVGDSYSFTSGTDVLDGGNGVDTFTGTLNVDTDGNFANNSTVTAFDKALGGEGKDILTITVTDGDAATAQTLGAGDLAALGLTTTGVETLNINTTVAATVNAADVAGFETVNVKGTTGAISVTSDNATSVSATTTGAVTISGAGATPDILTTASVSKSAGAVSVTSDVLNTLNLTSTTAGATVSAAAGTRTLTANVDGVTGSVIDATATDVVVNATGNASTLTALTIGAAKTLTINASKALTLTANTTTVLTTATVTGAGNVTLGPLASATTTKLDAATATGKVSATILATATTVNTGAGADTITQAGALGATQKIALGAGDDSIILGGALTALATIDGGDGTDNLSLVSATATGATNNVEEAVFSNFEQLTISDALAGNLNLANLDDIQNVVLAAGSGAFSVSGINTGATITYGAANTGTSVLAVTNAVAGTADVVNLVLSNTTAGVLAFGTVQAADVETVNITTKDVASTAANGAATIDTAVLVATSATSIVVTGTNGLTLTNAGNVKVTNFDASGVVGDSAADTAANLAVTFASANITAAANVTITGGAGNDTLTGNAGLDTINGGAGNDTIDGGAGNDTLNGGAGDDIITGGTGNDTIDGGAGNDTINIGLGADTVTLGEGTDTVAFDLANAVTAVSTVTDFNAGTSTTTVDTLKVDNNAATWAAAATVKQSTAAGVVDARLVILDSNTYSSLADAAAAADNIQQNAGIATYLFAWSDTSNVVHVGFATQDKAPAEAAVDQYVDLVKLTGVTLSTLDIADFSFV